MGGENPYSSTRFHRYWGSSPRGRGKHVAEHLRSTRRGLIPAWAGKTPQAPTTATCSGAHPRVGGENAWLNSWAVISPGSSPRGRGKLALAAPPPGVVRLIPAWAGKTLFGLASDSGVMAHPRVGGENTNDGRLFPHARGSSPRGRGKQPFTFGIGSKVGLIPAWAGKTGAARDLYLNRGAHPRVGGENYAPGHAHVTRDGSSPRGRGKQAGLWFFNHLPGLIPAWAGKTRR